MQLAALDTRRPNCPPAPIIAAAHRATQRRRPRAATSSSTPSQRVAITAFCSVERPSAPDLQPDGGSGAQYKTPEYNLFYADIVPNLTGRMNAATAWLDNIDNRASPLMPLPPAVPLDDAPIYRGGEPIPPTEQLRLAEDRRPAAIFAETILPGLRGGSPLGSASTASMPSIDLAPHRVLGDRGSDASSRQMKNWLLAVFGVRSAAIEHMPRTCG